MNRRDFLASATGAALASSCSRAPGAPPPNVILLMTDDQGYGDLRCHGNTRINTPNLDRLHSESVRFTNFHVDPTCSPTRSALMTGLYSHRAGVWHTIMGRNHLHRDEMTMAEVFRNSGYRTGIFGKWHLGGNYPYRPIDRGFDTWVGHGDGGTCTSSDYWGNDKLDDTYFRDGRWEQFEGFATDIYFDEAMSFIGANRQQPFFTYLPTNMAHNPWNVRPEWMQPYLDAGLPRQVARCYASITRIDENLGRLRRFLADNQLAENTLIIYLTDNGATVGANVFNAGMRGRKGSLYDGGHRVPCFLNWPGGGINQGRDISALTAHVDLLPTLTDLCNLNPPREIDYDGVSLKPLLDGAAAPAERKLLVETIRKPHTEKWMATVMTDRWRLVRGQELYDMKADPGQQRDVAADNPDAVAKLTAFYDDAYPGLCRHDDDFARPIIGAPEQPEAWLNGGDWFPETGESVPWAQGHVRDGLPLNGFWPVEVATAGRYEFELRRWPREANVAISAPAPELRDPRLVMDTEKVYAPKQGKALPITHARLEVSDQAAESGVVPADQAVRFQLDLTAGRHRIQTWFSNDRGLTLGAYHVYVRKTT